MHLGSCRAACWSFLWATHQLAGTVTGCCSGEGGGCGAGSCGGGTAIGRNIRVRHIRARGRKTAPAINLTNVARMTRAKLNRQMKPTPSPRPRPTATACAEVLSVRQGKAFCSTVRLGSAFGCARRAHFIAVGGCGGCAGWGVGVHGTRSRSSRNSLVPNTGW